MLMYFLGHISGFQQPCVGHHGSATTDASTTLLHGVSSPFYMWECWGQA